MNMNKLNFAIVGLGRGLSFIKPLSLIKNVDLLAVCDNYKPRLYSKELDELISVSHFKPEKIENFSNVISRKEIDAVIIATPTFLHKEMVIEALKVGKHVLCEKPMALTIEDCNKMIEASKRSDRIFQVGLVLRYTKIFQKAKEIISRGDIGKPQMMWCKEFRKPFAKKVNDWILKAENCGGALVEKNCHHFDLFNWLSESKPFRVAAFGGGNVIYNKEDITIIDNAWVLTEYENGIRGSLGLCLFSPYGTELEVGVIGDRGKLVCFCRAGEVDKIKVWNRKKTTKYSACKSYVFSLSKTYKWVGGHRGAEYDELLDFVDCIENNKQPIANGEVGKWSISVPLAAELSIREKRIVNLREIF